MTPFLTATAITLHRGPRPVVHAATLALHPGERLALIGPNGAGKSSLLAGLAGLLPPTAGSLHLGSMPLAQLTPEARARRIAWLPQSPSSAWGITVRDLAGLGRLPHHGSDQEALVERALQSCNLTELARARIDQVSGGEARRAHLARILATGAELLLLDEPTADLDPAHRLRLLDLLSAEAAQGRSVAIVLHDLDLALTWADRLILMSEGRILASAPPVELLSSPEAAAAFGVRIEPGGGLRMRLP